MIKLKIQVKEINYELISVLLLLGIAPMLITHAYCLIGILLYKNTFQYSLTLLYIELIILMVGVVSSIVVLLFSKSIQITSNEKYISIGDVVILKEKIKHFEYEKFNLILIPFLYFFKKGNGLIFKISYISEDGINENLSIRIRYKIYRKIKETL